MNKNRQIEKCKCCGKAGIEDVRKTYFYKGVLFEGLPAKHCPNCNETYYNIKTVELMDEVAANPQKRARMLKRPVWQESDQLA